MSEAAHPNARKQSHHCESLLRCDKRAYALKVPDMLRLFPTPKPLTLYEDGGLGWNLGRLTESLNEKTWPVV